MVSKMSKHQKINEDGVRVWIKTGNKVGREKQGEGSTPYQPTGRPRGRPGKVAKRDPPKVTTKSAAAAPAKTKGPGRPPKAAAAKKGQEEDEEENDDDDNDTVDTEE